MSGIEFPADRASLVNFAKIAEQCERHDEMLVAMKRVVNLSADLSGEERNLLSVAYKNVLNSRRSAQRVVSALEARGKPEEQTQSAAYNKQICAELADICQDLTNLLAQKLIPAAPNTEAKVFYYKMKGDYHRYQSEVDHTNGPKDGAVEAYESATKFAQELQPVNPVRLGLALNCSVFHYEILKDQAKGIKLAKDAFDVAVSHGLEGIEDEDQQRESSMTITLLRDNLHLWMEDMNDGADGAGGEDDMVCEDM